MEEKRIRRVNDPKAPRFRANKYTTKLVTKDTYLEWRKKNKEHKDITYAEFLEVWFMMTELWMDYVAENTDGIRIPYYIVDIAQEYAPLKKEHYDRKASNILGYDVKIKRKKGGKVVWSVNHARKKNKNILLYSFHVSRRFREKARGAFAKTPEKFKDSVLKKWQVTEKVKEKHE